MPKYPVIFQAKVTIPKYTETTSKVGQGTVSKSMAADVAKNQISSAFRYSI